MIQNLTPDSVMNILKKLNDVQRDIIDKARLHALEINRIREFLAESCQAEQMPIERD